MLRSSFLAFLLAAILVSIAPAASELTEPDFKEFGKLAVQDGGRRKPMDTYARESLMRISGRDNYKSASGRSWSAADFLLSMLLETTDWKKEPIILVAHRPLIEKLGLDPDKKRFSYEQLSKSPALEKMAKEVHQIRVQAGDEKVQLDRMQQEVESVSSRIGLFMSLSQGSTFLVVPAKNSTKEAWVIPPQYGQYYKDEDFAKATTFLQGMAKAYSGGDAFNFSLNSRELRLTLRSLSPSVYPTERELNLESFYNHLHAFSRAAWLFVLGIVGLGVFAARDGMPRPFHWIGMTAAVGGLLLMALGITLRCIIAGRPPVTNMFESVLWVSFVAVLFSFFFYLRYRAVLYLLASLPVAALCLALVLQMPISMPSNIDPLVPVLRDNFWLTVHVLSITASYGAFLMGASFGHIVIARYALWPKETAKDATLHFWNYRIIQLGTILLGAGTILGGVWANYSWGRFWGWDPKETWALIAFLCYIAAIHGKIAGWWSNFGLAVASCICFAAITMCWYGVNFVLGAGLHSYGFGTGGEEYVYGFFAVDLLLLSVAAARHLSAQRVSQPRVADEPTPAEAEAVSQ